MNRRINLIIPLYCGLEQATKDVVAANLANDAISTLHVLATADVDVSSLPHHDKVVRRLGEKPLTYEQAFRHANECDPTGSDIWILGTDGSSFDESLQLLDEIDFDHVLFALTAAPNHCTARSPSAARAGFVALLFTTPIALDTILTSYAFDTPESDVCIVHAFIGAGYLVANPAGKITVNRREGHCASGEAVDVGALNSAAPEASYCFLRPTDSIYLHRERSYLLYLESIKLLAAVEDVVKEQATEIRNMAQEKEYGSLALAECTYSLKLITSMYEAISTSFIWKYSAPIRTFLDNIKKFDSGAIVEAIKRFAVSSIVRQNWFGMLKDGSGNLAIVPHLASRDDLTCQYCKRLTNYLASRGYVVLIASVEGETLRIAPPEVSSSSMRVSSEVFLRAIGRSQEQRNSSRLIFVPCPFRPLVESFPAFRHAGFSIVADFVEDWEVSHANGKASWYEKTYEEQAVLSADVVAVASMSLKDKFLPLRCDIVCISTDDAPTLENDRFERLLSESANKCYMRNIYA